MGIVVRAVAAAAFALGLGAWTPYAAAEPVDLGGEPVEGSTDATTPTPLDAGLWTTTLGPQSRPQFFAYERRIEDSTVHIGVVATPQTPDYDGFYVNATVANPDDPESPVSCGSGDASSDTAFFDAPIGDEVQRRAAVEVLVDARRRLYGILADGPAPDETTEDE